MRQLTGLDTQFLAMENGRIHAHVGMVAILDPSTAPGGLIDAERIKEVLRERIHLLPPFRWRLVRVPFDLDHPYWIEDPDFDLDYHVRDAALPPPGDMKALGAMAAREASRPLDRTRPLWELQIVHGLPDGKVAMLSKVHHAAVDGMSGAEIMGVLLDLDPQGREIEPPDERRPEGMPNELGLVVRGIARLPLHPLRGLRSLPSVLPGLDAVPPARNLPLVGKASRFYTRAVKLPGQVLGNTDGGILEMPEVKAPRTPYNGEVHAARRFAFGSLSLETVKEIKRFHGVTVNDVVMSLCAGALRAQLIERGALPTDPLVVMVPLSVRQPEQVGTFGNKISMMVVPIPTDLADPVERLAMMNATMTIAKTRHQALPATLLSDATQFIPPALFARAVRSLFKVAASGALAPSLNLVISNVPGSPFPLYLGGARLETVYPVSVLFEGVGLNITVMSYLDHLDFGLIADRELEPEVWTLMDHLHRELDALAASVGKKAAKPAKAAASIVEKATSAG
ncbi:MAG TPA: wax ester/triacylglycerol synthase family O-acyltransferase [Mycobacteriales bacterium]